MKDDRHEPQFGYNARRDEPHAAISARPVRSRRRERSLVPIFLVGAVIILFGGFLWISYVKEPKLVGGQLPMIAADTTPIKVKPDKPGGAEIPFQDTTVYDDLGKQKHAPQEVEHLLEPAEQPLPIQPPAPVAEAAVQPSGPPVAETRPTVAVPSQPLPSREDIVPSITSDNEAALAPPPQQAPVAPPLANTSKPATTVAVKPKPAPPPSAGVRNSIIQLGSFKDEAAAKTEWQRLKTRYSDQLSALSSTVLRVDLGDKGIWYRLRAGPLTVDKAKAACTSLTNAKAPCIVQPH